MRLAKRRRVGPGDPMAVVTRFLDAANHHDSDTLYASVHPEFESFQPLHPDRNFRGPGQLISNWKAIFEAEPGFRLTVLRASTTGNTVWVELHGAGDSAEAAGIFILGVENSRIRWVRVYSDLVEGGAEQDPAESTAQASTTTEQPGEAVPEPERPSGEAGPMSAPAADSEVDDPDSDGPGSGPLRLVEAADGPVPETATASDPSLDPGLRLVDPTAPEPEHAGPAPEPDPGPVETLVGPSRIVPVPEAAVEETQSTGETSPEEPSDEPATTDQAHDAGAGPSFDEPDTDTGAGTTDEAEAEAEIEVDPPTEEPSGTDGPADPTEPQSSDTASPAGEPVLSRLRKVFRKS
ncbi:MAG: nuclear transport factor 2 family protein [Actinomycetota bacterium]|nr:nuclear transport factor 2 family protein [Actinomycetota bacterium]